MNHEQIKHITANRYKKLSKYSKKAAGSFDAEDIHQFRVEYKKLRAFLRMLSHGYASNREITIAKSLKKSYSIAGAIRDMQLQQLRIQEAIKNEPKKPLAYLRILQHENDNLKPDFAEFISENPVAEAKKKTDALLPRTFPVSNFKNFIYQKWETVIAILNAGNFSDDNIHAIRKMLKDLFYNLKEYTGFEHDTLGADIRKGKDDQYFQTLLDDLGNFQDQCIAVALLKPRWLTDMKGYHKELLEHIKQHWIKNKIRTKQSLLKKLKAGFLPQQINHTTELTKTEYADN